MRRAEDQWIEMHVRILMANDSSLEAMLFPLPSHHDDAPVEMLEGYINRRRDEFFPARLADGSEQLLPLSRCLVFELSYETQERMRAMNPDTSAFEGAASSTSAVSYAAVVVTLITGRALRGDFWFHTHEPEHERNVASRLNHPERYLCLHSDQATLFVRRDAIMRVQLLPQGHDHHPGSHQAHLQRPSRHSGLVNVRAFRSLNEPRDPDEAGGRG